MTTTVIGQEPMQPQMLPRKDQLNLMAFNQSDAVNRMTVATADQTGKLKLMRNGKKQLIDHS